MDEVGNSPSHGTRYKYNYHTNTHTNVKQNKIKLWKKIVPKEDKATCNDISVFNISGILVWGTSTMF
jgi:hypothetical protein